LRSAGIGDYGNGIASTTAGCGLMEGMSLQWRLCLSASANIPGGAFGRLTCGPIWGCVMKQTTPERRASRRYALSVPVLVRTPSHRSRVGRTQDLSPDGLHLILETDEDLVPGTELDFALTFSTDMTCGFEVQVRARGRAVRVGESGKMEPGCMEIAAVIESYDFMHSTLSRI